MAAFTLAEALSPAIDRAVGRLLRKQASGGVHITGRAIRGGSKLSGSFEDTFFRAPAPGEGDRQLRALKLALDNGKTIRREIRRKPRPVTREEDLLMKLTDATIRIYEELVALCRACKGAVYPSYDTLADRTGRSRNTVWRAIAALEALGFLIRQRRFKTIDDAQGAGPRYEQTSNAYRLELPAFAAKLLPRWLRPAPIPDDHAHREEERVLDVAHMFTRLSCRDQAREITRGGNAELGRLLESLGAALDERTERESQIGAAPLNRVYNKRAQMSWPSRPARYA